VATDALPYLHVARRAPFLRVRIGCCGRHLTILEQLSVEGVCLPRAVSQSSVQSWPPSIVSNLGNLGNFIYKTLCAPTKTERTLRQL